MKMNPEEVLRETFQHLIDRKVKQELMQDFITHSRRYHEGNSELQSVLDELEKQI